MNLDSKTIQLPIKEDDLWPPGQLLQLIGYRPLGFKGGSIRHAGAFVITLTKSELLVLGGKYLTWGEELQTGDYKNGLDFYEPGKPGWDFDGKIGEFRCRVTDISKVVLGRFGRGTTLKIWTRDANGQERQSVGMILITLPLPKTFMSVANKAADEGLLKRRWGLGYNWHVLPFFRWEVGRRFKQALPGADVQVKGRIVDESVFMKIVR